MVILYNVFKLDIFLYQMYLMCFKLINYQDNEKHKENVTNEECRADYRMSTFYFRKVEISKYYPKQGKDRVLEVTITFNLFINK
jgi:hypothetical protein